VRDKAALDSLMIGELCSRVMLPEPDPAQWHEQALDVCRQLRDQYLRYPGIARAALESAPLSLDTMRIYEGLLAVLTAGGASVRTAAWAIDAAFLYIGAYSNVAVRRRATKDAADQDLDRAEVIERFQMLPADRFPITAGHAEELTSGEGHDRFDFTLGQLFAGLTSRIEGTDAR
jgi:hypothetical protein